MGRTLDRGGFGAQDLNTTSSKPLPGLRDVLLVIPGEGTVFCTTLSSYPTRPVCTTFSSYPYPNFHLFVRQFCDLCDKFHSLLPKVPVTYTSRFTGGYTITNIIYIKHGARRPLLTVCLFWGSLGHFINYTYLVAVSCRGVVLVTEEARARDLEQQMSHSFRE